MFSYFLKPLCQLSFLKSFLNTGNGLSLRLYLCSWGPVSFYKMYLWLHLIHTGIVSSVLWHVLPFPYSYLYGCDLAFTGWQIAVYRWLCACGFVCSHEDSFLLLSWFVLPECSLRKVGWGLASTVPVWRLVEPAASCTETLNFNTERGMGAEETNLDYFPKHYLN